MRSLLRCPLQRALQPALRSLCNPGGNDFSLASLWAAGNPGMWDAPDRPAALVNRRNLLTWSEQLDNAAWASGAGGITVIANVALAVDGSMTADKLEETATTDTHRRGHSLVAMPYGDKRFSIFVSAAGRTVCRGWSFPGVNTQQNTFDLVAKTASGPLNPTITDMGGGIFRCAFDVKADATGTVVFGPSDGVVAGTDNYAGTAGMGIHVWGAQLEMGTAATAYQKVTDWGTEYLAAAGNQAACYQDVIGTTPVTAVEQPVGLMLDKRLTRLSLPTTGWVKVLGDGVVSVVGNTVTITGATTQTRVVPAVSRTMVPGLTRIRGTYTGTAVSPLLYVAGSPLGLISGVSTLHTFFSTNSSFEGFQINSGNATFVIESYEEWRGNHASQATAAARPVLRARANLQLASEDFTDAVWGKLDATVVANNAVSFDGTMTADTVTGSALSAVKRISQNNATGVAKTSATYRVKAGTQQFVQMYVVNDGVPYVNFDLVNGTLSAFGGAQGYIEAAGNGYYDITMTFTSASSTAVHGYLIFADSLTHGRGAASAVATSTTLFLARAQLTYGERGRYQRVNTAADYDAVGFPHYLKFDGVDDGLVTPPFVAGTLTADMDCFMLVRKDVSGDAILLYTDPGVGGGGYLGCVSTTDSAGAHVNAGTPTYYVNGVGVTATRSALHAAVGVGQWRILEVRNANLSTWVGARFGGASGYSGFFLNGAIGGIVLCPAQSAAKRTEIRQALAAQVGITLP